jgi:Zn-dependent protease
MPGPSFWIAIAGPMTNVVIGLIAVGTALLVGWRPGTEPHTPSVAVLLWLGYINVMLAVFNMIPGYPLDGGRVLRAVIWWITSNVDRSTRLAAQIGQAVALVFILLGLFQFFGGPVTDKCAKRHAAAWSTPHGGARDVSARSACDDEP